MAQTGYTPILIYSSSTVSQAPAAGNLTNSTLGSELAINITDGKLFYKDNANAVQVIAWKTTPTTAGGTGLTSYTAGDLLYYASGTALSKLAIGTSGRWLGSSGTAPQWNAPAALTKTDDTNVTLTLGGNASTALLNAASLTLGWTGQLATSRGGTGLSSFTANGILYASSTSALATSSNLTWNGATLYANVATGTSRIQLVTQDLGGINFLIDVNSSACEIGSPNGVPLVFKTGGADRGRFDTSGNLKVENGNFVQGTAAKGVNFTANTPAAGMTSQLLNWYEEGTFTPTFVPSGTGFTSITYATARGAQYIRVGRMVHVQIWLETTATTIGSASGVLRVDGLPFTTASSTGSTSNGFGALSVSYADGFPTVAPQAAMPRANSTQIDLYYATGTSTGPASQVTAAQMGTGAVALVLAGTYICA